MKTGVVDLMKSANSQTCDEGAEEFDFTNNAPTEIMIIFFEIKSNSNSV